MAKDIILEDGDLLIRGGDFVVDEAPEQHIEHILLARKGQYRQWPLVGVGIADYHNAPMTTAIRTKLEREIKLQIESDGAIGVEVEVSNDGGVSVNQAFYP